ncbi:MAG: hypothetical protein IKU19_05565 [Clostridia bacterium]|nr:hypothetical protein [Clostridia bacterium]
MKKLISVLLIFSMIFAGSVSAFAADTESEIYDLSKLFVNYDEKSLPEMVRYINENQDVYGFIEFFRNHGVDFDKMFSAPEVEIYMSGIYKNSEVFNAFYSRLTDEHSKYIILNTSRPTTPESSTPYGTVMLGEKGNKCFYIDFTDEFFSYIKTLDRLDGNVFIMDFLLNLLSDDVVGISFSWHKVYMDPELGKTYDGNTIECDYSSFASAIVGDCNGDGAVNAVDSYIMRILIVGNECKADPFAIDMDGDGGVNAKDSLLLKTRIVKG